MDINFYKVWFSTVNDSFVFGINGMVTTALQQLTLFQQKIYGTKQNFQKSAIKPFSLLN